MTLFNLGLIISIVVVALCIVGFTSSIVSNNKLYSAFYLILFAVNITIIIFNITMR